MAFGGYGTSLSPVAGFEASSSGLQALSGIDREKFSAEADMATGALSSKAQLEGQKALARAQQYAADKQYAAATDPGRLIAGVFGDVASAAVGGFTGGLGTAAGKKWFA